ncbi:hypothetical protein pb186bvf_007763 [Paramecium bursaria]
MKFYSDEMNFDMQILFLIIFHSLAQEEEQIKQLSLMKATLGGGCFWCTEAVFKRIEGVKDVYPGYAGGTKEEATYDAVCSGRTGHAEVIQLSFDPAIVPYAEILRIFFKSHDPTSLNRQGADQGTQYRSVIFYHDEEQKNLATQIKKQLTDSNAFGKPVVTEISPIPEFFKAEKYHWDYYDQNPNQGYCRAVINPKVDKVLKDFKDKIKAGYK